MNVLMELTDMIFIHFCELLLMFVSYDYDFVFYWPYGTPKDHSHV